ncbi:MAG: ATP-binding cassette domain-containing protein [Actinomycetota bacterium]
MTTRRRQLGTASDAFSSASDQTGIRVHHVSRQRAGRTVVDDVSFSIRPGELVAIAGGSGAGKTSLLRTMAGLDSADAGQVHVDGVPVAGTDHGIGYVPQDDIIHMELPLRRTLDHAARLRVAGDVSAVDRDELVTRTLDRLALCDRDHVPVGDLSGGQRKRASIASELLTDPEVLFLDEPTSGLDPGTAASVMHHLRRLAEAGTTVVMTTHAPADLARCDRLVMLTDGGRLAFDGPPTDALEWFGVTDLVHVYEVLATADPVEVAERFRQRHPVPPVPFVERRPVASRGTKVGGVRQWLALTRRAGDLLVRNKLTLAILAGSPAMVVAMMAVLFRPGTFDPSVTTPVPAIQTLFWIAFASFFFGLTYGLLQIVGEFSVFRRERFNGLSVWAYVASKIVVLIPVLALVNVVMLVVLRSLDRLPSLGAGAWAELFVTLQLTAIAALAIGLLASAAVQNASQATMALPMLCFPQVLFAGAVVPVEEMATAGRIMSFGLIDRWSFEALGRTLDINALIGDDVATAGYVPAFSGSPVTAWLVMGGLALAATLATGAVLARRS